MADLSKAKDRIEATFPLVSDLGSKKTSKYSSDGFATYIVDRDGKIASVLPGTKKRRPMAKKILKELQVVATEAAAR